MSFDGAFVEIHRTGGFMSIHRKGSKRIPIRMITAVRFKDPDLSVGFLQLNIVGDPAPSVRKRWVPVDEVEDENSIVFTKKSQSDFNRLREAIESGLAALNFASDVPPTFVADELEKLASLRNAGVINDAEFAAQRAKLIE